MSTETAHAWPGPITHVTLFAEDFDATRDFYLRVFALPVHWQDDVSCVFLFGEQMINLLRSTEAPELVEPRPIAPAAAGVRMQLTLMVDDVDATCAMLAQRGVELLNGPQDRPWGIRTAAFADPAGHVWEVAHETRHA